MIVSLNLPEELVGFIDQQATEKKVSRSAWVAALVDCAFLMESPMGKKAFAQSLVEVIAERALSAGLSMEQVHKAFPQLEDPRPPRALEHPALPSPAPPTPQLPTGPLAADATASPSTPPSGSAPIAFPITRRRPYQRASKGPINRQLT